MYVFFEKKCYNNFLCSIRISHFRSLKNEFLESIVLEWKKFLSKILPKIHFCDLKMQNSDRT